MNMKESAAAVLGELSEVFEKLDPEQYRAAIDLIKESRAVYCLGLGRAGFMGKSFVMRLMHMGMDVYVVGETNTPNFGPGDLLIVTSGSGETGQLVNIARKAKDLGGKVLAFTAAGGSTLAKLSDAAIVIAAPSKAQLPGEVRSIQPMASLFEQSILLIGDAMVLTMMGEADTSGGEMFQKHANLE